MPSLTPDSELKLAFDPSLIPASFRERLSSDIHVRISFRPCSLYPPDS